jgi:hypothetical protein
MPFKKDTASTVLATQEVATCTLKPLSQEGLNLYNLKDYVLAVNPDEPGISPEEMNKRLAIQQQRMDQVNALLVQTQQHTQQQQQGKSVETYGLVMPVVEYVPKPNDKLTALDSQIASLVVAKIWDCVVYNELYFFFTIPTAGETVHTPQQRLQAVVNKASMHDYQVLMEVYKIPTIDQATDVAVLALFDIIELIDDSTSMKCTGYRDFTGRVSREDYDEEENDRAAGIDHNYKSRWQLAEQLVNVTSYALTMFDTDGISIRFLNYDHRVLPKLDGVSLCDNVGSTANIASLFQCVQPNGGTAIGASLQKIYRELVEPKLQTQTLAKPIMLITYTDGDSNDSITAVIRGIRREFRSSRYGSRGMLFSFNQVGRDKKAREMLSKLDKDTVANDPEAGAGPITDCTSSFKDEKEEYDLAQSKLPLEAQVEYTAAFHILKGMIGPAIAKYDNADEGGSSEASKSVFGFGV